MGYRFTGKERDQETGLDYFGAMYFSGAQGSFTSPDAPLAKQSQTDEQRWNMYAYVRKNLLKNTNPNGRDCFRTEGALAQRIREATRCGWPLGSQAFVQELEHLAGRRLHPSRTTRPSDCFRQ